MFGRAVCGHNICCWIFGAVLAAMVFPIRGASACSGIKLARHQRRQESILLDSADVNIQIWRQRSNTKALKELEIND